MKNCYDGVLAMPQSYAVMDEEEMTYLNGGGKRVTLNENFCERSYCSWYAGMMLRHSEVSGMTQKEIAKELYAHAVSLYQYVKVALRLGVTIAAYCYNTAKDGIADIEDGGDTFLRKSYYNIIWTNLY